MLKQEAKDHFTHVPAHKLKRTPSRVRYSVPISFYISFYTSDLTLVVQTLDRTIHRINHHPEDKYQGNQLCYPLDRDLSMQWIVLSTLNNQGQDDCKTVLKTPLAKIACSAAGPLFSFLIRDGLAAISNGNGMIGLTRRSGHFFTSEGSSKTPTEIILEFKHPERSIHGFNLKGSKNEHAMIFIKQIVLFHWGLKDISLVAIKK